MRRGWSLCCLIQFLLSLQLYAQVHFDLVSSETVKTRLDLYKGNDRVREAALVKTFTDAGCPAASLSEQAVPGRKEPNVICVLPGETSEVVLIGAHFDHVPEGSGIVDNWSGASLLPSLFQSLAGSRRKHTFVFVGFTGEESGEVGSRYYVGRLSKIDSSQIELMITLDSIGLGPTKVWASRSDKQAVALLAATARLFKLPIGAVNVDGFGESDEEPFIKQKVRTITIHSLTPETSHVIHTARDAPAAISFSDYYDTYHLLAGYLAILDTQLDADPTKSAAQPR
jgi:Iap family predicted aminopeptidase